MKFRIASILIIVFSFISQDLFSQIVRLALSPVQKTEIKIGLTNISLEYSRPSKRDRKIFGELVPFNEYWRTGANRSSKISFSEDLILNGEKIKKGKYAIFTIPGPNEWEVVLYSDLDGWDVPEEVEESKIVGRIKVLSKKSPTTKEVFTINIVNFTNYNFDLDIAWDNTMITVPFELVTRELMDKKIARVLAGPSDVDYYAAAVYEMESGGDYAKGLEYINSAISLLDEVSFWELRIKAILLEKLGKKTEALQIANQGLEISKEIGSEYGIREFNKVLKKLK